MIHFAAHAETNAQRPLESAVILSRSGDRYKLYARDIAGLKLSASLVTISACRSAGARTYGGEGLVGFAWAFLQAGAHAVIAGLWDVGDQTSSALMDKLYEGIASGMSPAAALKTGQTGRFFIPTAPSENRSTGLLIRCIYRSIVRSVTDSIEKPVKRSSAAQSLFAERSLESQACNSEEGSSGSPLPLLPAQSSVVSNRVHLDHAGMLENPGIFDSHSQGFTNLHIRGRVIYRWPLRPTHSSPA